MSVRGDWWSRLRYAALLGAAAGLAGCAAWQEHRDGLEAIRGGEAVRGIEQLRRATELDPHNVDYQRDYVRHKEMAVQRLLRHGDEALAAGQTEQAGDDYREASRIEPANARARQGLDRIDREAQATVQLDLAEQRLQSGKASEAFDLAGAVLRDSPGHRRAAQVMRAAEQKVESQRLDRERTDRSVSSFRRPVSLAFKDAPLKLVFEALMRGADINVVVDREVKTDARTTIFVKEAAIEDAIDVLLLQNQLEKRILNGNTILVYPASQARQLAELKVRTFQLSNVDAASMANIIKAMVRTKDLVADPKTNVIVMRDTPEAIALTERLIAANDLPEAEVMLEVNVMEISSTRASDIGLKFPTSGTLSTPLGTGDASLTAGQLRALDRGQLLVSPLSLTLNLMLQDSETKLLARPHIRARHKEKARILVGDKLPQITNVLAPQQTGASTVLTGSIQYVDVGIKLEIEPEVYADGDVGIKLLLEVSNVTDTIQTQSGRAYQIGTRSAQTSLRLHDGETQILGGLISDSDRASAQKVPGLGQLPVLGRLFSDHADNASASEIVVSITPRIVRARAVPELRYSDAWSGSEAVIRDRPLRLDSIGALNAPTPGDKAVAPGMPVSPSAPLPVTPSGLPVIRAAPPIPAPASGTQP